MTFTMWRECIDTRASGLWSWLLLSDTTLYTIFLNCKLFTMKYIIHQNILALPYKRYPKRNLNLCQGRMAVFEDCQATALTTNVVYRSPFAGQIEVRKILWLRFVQVFYTCLKDNTCETKYHFSRDRSSGLGQLAIQIWNKWSESMYSLKWRYLGSYHVCHQFLQYLSMETKKVI